MERFEGILIAFTALFIFLGGFLASSFHHREYITNERVIYIDDHGYKCTTVKELKD